MAGVSSCQNALSSLNIDSQERTQSEDNNPDSIPVTDSPNKTCLGRRASINAIPEKALLLEKASAFERTGVRPCMGRELTKSNILEAGKLREKRADYIPVAVEKDASVDIPGFDMKKSFSTSISVISTTEECSSKNEIPLERTEAETTHGDSKPIPENSAARPEISNLECKRKRILTQRPQTGPIVYLDFWNHTDDPLGMHAEKAAIEGTLLRGMDRKKTEEVIKMYRDRNIKEVWELREQRPDYIPVTVEKDALSHLPDIDVKKYHVPGAMPLGEFVHSVIRVRTKVSIRKRIFVFLKNTVPPAGALMSTIYKENEDEDGYLRIIYSGNGNAHGSVDHEQHWLVNTPPKVVPRRSRAKKSAKKSA